jgi:aldehyde dehydrogenase (NAD+)
MTTVAEIFETMEYGPAPESDSQAREWIREHGDGRFGHFVNGQWRAATESFEVSNPATG